METRDLSARRTRRAWVGAVVVAIGLLAAGRPALALRYKPKPDETLSHVALIHYGDPKKFIYLLAPNGLTDPDRLPSGRVLFVPTVWQHRLRKGEDLSGLAKKHLKDADRTDFLVWLNGVKNPKDVASGTSITIPFLVRHRVQEGQSMVDVARRYYWSTQHTGLLRKFNGRRTNALSPGDIVLVPIFDREATLDRVKERLERNRQQESAEVAAARERARREAEATRPDPDPEVAAVAEEPVLEPIDRLLDEPRASIPVATTVTSPEQASLVQQAHESYQEGEYELAQALLSRLLDGGAKLAPADEAEVREILAFCLVALDRDTEAEHEFVRLLMIAPDRNLDPVTTSPKVLAVFRRAKGGR